MVTRATPAKKAAAKKTVAKKATAKKAPARNRAPAAREAHYSAQAGKAKLGGQYDPSVVERGAAVPELMEPRPTRTSRYPISNEQFNSLKQAAPRSKLAASTAMRSKDGPTRATSRASRSALAPSAAPVALNQFAGISATGWLPPDCTMAAGPNHVLVSVNSSIALYTKAGAAVWQKTLTVWFGALASGLTVFDPKLLYDQHTNRWVVLAVAVSAPNKPKASAHLLSISKTADPNGAWFNYKLDAMKDGATATNNWADYPALGVDNQALYITSNMFQFGGGFKYVKVRVVPKTGPYAGGAAPFFDFTNLKNADNTLAFTIQPCHTFGAPQLEYLVNTLFPSGNALTVWRIANGGSAAPTLTRTQVAVSPYSLAPDADQPGGVQALNTGDVRVLHAVFRGDSIWCAFTTAHNWGGANNRASIQWCQIRAATPAVVQQGVFGAAAAHYFYPAPCPDNNGNLVMVFSRSGKTEFGSIGYTGRKSTDALGSLQPSTVLKAGVAPYVGLDGNGRNRWGDYAGVCADPANSPQIWFYSVYASALNTWGSWVGSATA